MASPDIDESDAAAVLEVVRSGRLALGPKTEEFESGIAGYVGAAHAVAVSSGTAALHLIIRALGIGPGDEVLVPSFTFAASANAVLYEGAAPVFVDILPDTFTLDPDDAEKKVTPRTRAVMAVDVFGHPAEWDPILSLAERHGLRTVDDSCEALGAEYRGGRLGGIGDAAAFAFYPNKQITTGEGGMIVTDDGAVAAAARSLLNQGRLAMGSWLAHETLGFNYRIDEMSAALGVSQLKRIETFLEKRERVSSLYTQRLEGFDWVHPPVVKDRVRMSWFVYSVLLAEGVDRDGVMSAMQERGVPTRAYFTPLHLQPYIAKLLGTERGLLPVTESIAGRTLALPFHNNMTVEDVELVVEALAAAVEGRVQHR
jgi:perosamine synthetase